MAGADFNLEFVQKLALDVNRILFGGKSRVVILSNKGLIVADTIFREHSMLPSRR